MARYRKPDEKPDKRKIPLLFRAVERDSSPTTYYGRLISDDGFNFVFLGAHDKETSQLLERIHQKKEYSFSKISKDDFMRHARRGLTKMKRETEDAKMNFEAAQAEQNYAEELLGGWI